MGGAESRIFAKSKRLASWTDDRKLQQMGQDRTGLDSGRDWMGQAINLLIHLLTRRHGRRGHGRTDLCKPSQGSPNPAVPTNSGQSCSNSLICFCSTAKNSAFGAALEWAGVGNSSLTCFLGDGPGGAADPRLLIAPKRGLAVSH